MKKTFNLPLYLLMLLLLTSCGSSLVREGATIPATLAETPDLAVRATNPGEPPEPPTNTNTSSGVSLKLNPEVPDTWGASHRQFSKTS